MMDRVVSEKTWMARFDAEASTSRSHEPDDDTVYVAVSKDYEENKMNLLWALENFPGKKFCILHVHQPARSVCLFGGKFPASRLKQNYMEEFQELERKIMLDILDDYVHLCEQVEVNAEKLCTEMDDVGNGIVELVYQYDIKKLVMGAAASKHYSEEMMDLKSRKAKYVQQHVPCSCQISYICKGYVICTWEGGSYSSTHGYSFTNGFADSASVMLQRTEGSGLELEAYQSEEDGDSLDPLDVNGIDELYSQLEQAMLEAEKLKREAFEESLKRGEAEKTAIKATCRAKAIEILYARELKYRKGCEKSLERERECQQRMREEWDEERLIARDQRLLHQVDFDNKMKELNDERFSAVEQCKEYKKERDGLLAERDSFLKLVEELSKKLDEDSPCSQVHQYLPVFSVSEIEVATCNFDPLLRIGEAQYGTIYKGTLHRTQVTIELLNQESAQGPSEFRHKVALSSKLRHPNLPILLGACLEPCALIHEYLPNGSIEDRLSCKDNTPPLPWEVRISIAMDLCSVLIFLHSSSPHSIVHGDLKSGNVFLDANFSCKLTGFGICSALSVREHSSGTRNSHGTDHLDPHFLATGELSMKSDTYSFGVILLQLLTGRSSSSNIVREIQDVVDERNLNSLLDPLAGDWPFVQAEQLAHLALDCCKNDQNYRPDLASEVLRVLEQLRSSSSSPIQFDDESEQPPSYFICPILQDVMQDPHVAADGFTYEAQALRDWFNSGHNTSPLTNLQLPHRNLIPNRTLRSAIQEWTQNH